VSPAELFLHPTWLALLVLAPMAWFVARGLSDARASRAFELMGPRARTLTPGVHRPGRRARRGLLVLGLAFALLALPQPVWGEGARNTEQRGVDILVCLDVSRSMLARDQSPDRLTAAKRAIADLTERARGDRFGLVAFAGDARLVAPLSQDAESFTDLVEQTDTLSVALGGTDLGAALTAALDALGAQSGEHEAVLLLTDGEDNEARGLAVAATCRERGITVHCVGFGSDRGSKIAVGGPGGDTFLRDRAGNEIVTKMDPASLRRIAEATGGAFARASASDTPLVDVYNDEIVPLASKAFEAERRRERENRFQWPLAAAFILWILALCAPTRR